MTSKRSSATETTFSQLYRHVENSKKLSVVYQDILKELDRRTFWTGGLVGLRKVLWADGFNARDEDRIVFGFPGIYLWGVENRPLYIGITRRSFRSRFNRYIWSKDSQCNLAHRYGHVLSVRGMHGFPRKILYSKSKVRREGAVRFAEEGIAKVWFGIFPHNNCAEIEALEPKLISVAQEWNRKCGFRSLLNIEFNKKNRNHI